MGPNKDVIILHLPNPPEEPKAHFKELLVSARQGDEAALDELLGRFYGQVSHKVHQSLASDLRATRPWLHARFSTGDVVQEVFRSVVKDIGRFVGDTEYAFTGYLAMIIRNRIMDAVRFHEASKRDARRINRGDDARGVASHRQDPAVEVSANEEIVLFQRIFAELSEQEKLLLRGRMEQSYSFEKLAEFLGYPSTSTARRAYYLAQARLATRLKEGGADQQRYRHQAIMRGTKRSSTPESRRADARGT